MSDTVISVENLSKEYRLGVLGRDTFNAEVQSWWAKVRGKPDPTLKIGQIHHGNREGEHIWALRDVSFEVKQGEILGIIGRNGAGKSTLLKILSRIIAPTSGRIKVRGRVASLLEVGTGFHPELTGRENIYLNGAILGMSKAEIRAKFDEIVAFSEIEDFIDTPTKRYSSGMTVRLAFAVAAHLEPEILVVDEVLAVGDAAFQKKCLGKMEDVSRGGRTVLFVSHNMATVTSLCEKAILLDSGLLATQGFVSEVVMSYYRNMESSPAFIDFSKYPKPVGDDIVNLLEGAVLSTAGKASVEFDIDAAFKVAMKYKITKSTDIEFVPNFHFYTSDGTCVFVSAETEPSRHDIGEYQAECLIPGTMLNEGVYFVGLAVSSFKSGIKVHFYEKNCLSFNIKDPIYGTATRTKNGYIGPIPGITRPKLEWCIGKIS